LKKKSSIFQPRTNAPVPNLKTNANDDLRKRPRSVDSVIVNGFGSGTTKSGGTSTLGVTAFGAVTSLALARKSSKKLLLLLLLPSCAVVLVAKVGGCEKERTPPSSVRDKITAAVTVHVKIDVDDGTIVVIVQSLRRDLMWLLKSGFGTKGRRR
jgi:hypothetical protein